MAIDFKHGQITELILRAFFQVYGKLGYGFSEKIYENAMAITSQKLGLTVVQQAPVAVYFDQRIIGNYAVDLLVNNLVIVEIKALRALIAEHEAQLLSYLKATPYEVGLLLNFGAKPQCKRRVYDNALKGDLSWCESGLRTRTNLMARKSIEGSLGDKKP